ncbi:MAG: heme ABC transporter permease [Deltaproteobacteria bacterium]|nr:heme ABC transporter permease [Deltaproteobacteria bacterium]
MRTFVFLCALLVALTFLSFSNGAVSISVTECMYILLSTIGFDVSYPINNIHQGVLLEIRIPRTILAIMVGAGLSISGALMQGLFRNPLADPGLVGISSGAALGAALVIVLGWSIPFLEYWTLPIAAFIGAVISTICVMRLSQMGGKTVVTNMLLAGIAINAIAGAGTGLMVYLAEEDQLRDLTFWTLGSFGGAKWIEVQLAFLVIVIPSFIGLFLSRSLNIMLLGEAQAHMLGVSLEKIKKTIVVLVCIIVGSSVSMTGMIGFVGLVVPHLCRMLVGADNRKVIPASILLGGSLLLASDLLSRTLIMPAEFPIGIVTSIVGGPFFLMLLSMNQKNQVW